MEGGGSVRGGWVSIIQVQHSIDAAPIQGAAGVSGQAQHPTGVARRGPVGSAPAPGLSSAHISPLVPGKVDCWIGGSLVTVSVPHVRRRVGGGLRGRCGPFSKASRRRLMRRMATIRDDATAVFVTLTYPAEYPADWHTWKRHLDTFLKRLERKRPEAGVVWKLEPQARGAPHFHLLIFGASYALLRWWVAQAWFEVVGSGDGRHLRAGTRVERLRSARGARAYAAKYLGKLPDVLPEGVDWEEVGRWWGIRRPENIPWATCVTLEVGHTEAWRVLRVLRKYLERVAGVWVRPGARALSAYMDGQRFCDALPLLL